MAREKIVQIVTRGSEIFGLSNYGNLFRLKYRGAAGKAARHEWEFQPAEIVGSPVNASKGE